VARRISAVATAAFVALALVTAALGVDGALAASGSALTPPPTTCPVGDQCVAIGSGANPPEAVVGPTTNLGSSGEGDQWIYVTLYDFPPGDLVTLHYCSDATPLATSPPLCDDSGTQEFPNPIAQLPIGPHGTASLSVQVEEQQPANDTPLEGQVPGVGTTGSFYCDNGPDLCAVDVTDPSLDTTSGGTPTPANTAVVPVTFAVTGTGCAGASEISSESDFGIGFLLPAATALSCSGTKPALALNISQNDLSAAQALAAGTDDVAFIDNPESPDIQSALSGASYTYIPVAVTADVIGFRALMFDRGNRYVFPDSSFNLTPTAAAGILTYTYTGPVGADMVPCSSVPSKALSGLVGTGCVGGQVSLLSLANENGSFLPPREFATYMRADASGSTQELLTWICDAPNAPVPVPGGTVSDPNLAPTVLQDGFDAGGDKSAACPSSGPAADQWPALSTFSQSFAQALTPPSKQVSVLDANVPAPSLSDTTFLAGFAPMVWSEANYYGLSVASVQNAAGDWVQPTPTSIDAALTKATANPDGTLTYNFDDPTDAAAYPMPDVIYAVVPKAPLPATEASAVQSTLNSLLSVSAEPTSDLPGGFVQLPSTLFSEATEEVANDIVAVTPPAGTTTSKTTGSGSSSGSSTGSSSGGSGSTTGPSSAGPTTPTPPGSSGASATSATPLTSGIEPTPLPLAAFTPVLALSGASPPLVTGPAPGAHPVAKPLVVPNPRSLTLLAADDRWLGPGLAAALAWTLLLGPGLYLAVELRRRGRRTPKATAVAGAGDGGGTGTDHGAGGVPDAVPGPGGER
jgi:hypothetical protein